MGRPVITEANWPSTTDGPLEERPIGRILQDRAAEKPDRAAVKWRSAGGDIESLSYADLLGAAGELAARILAVVERGQRLAIAASTSVDWLIGEYAAALAGTPLVPINPAFTDGEIAHLLETSDVRLVFADAEFRGTPLLDRLAPLVGTRTATLHRLDAWRDLPRASGPLPEVSASEVFLVQFTSGTTGRPKGAQLSHRAAYNSAALMIDRFGAGADDNWLNTMPMHHVGGSVSIVLSMLSVGGTVTLMPTFDPALALELIAATSVTISGGVPTMLLAMLDHVSFSNTDLSSIRLLMSGGSMVAPSLIRRVESAFGVAIANAYGQSESPNATITSFDDDDETKATTIGRPLPHRAVKIAGADGSILGLGQAGEMWMRGPLVMDGYLGVEPEVNARTLDGDGWLHTGDLCSMDERGVVRIVGRLRDVVIRGGENIYPAEVEDVMLQHHAVAEIAVIAMPDDRWGEVPVGVLRVTAGATVDDAELERHGREHLAGFKVPRRWVSVEGFPLTASGKIKKFELQQQLANGPAAEGPATDGLS